MWVEWGDEDDCGLYESAAVHDAAFLRATRQ